MKNGKLEKAWTISDLKDLLDGNLESKERITSVLDIHDLNPVAFGAMKAATNSAEVIRLLTPPDEEPSISRQLLELLQQIAASQIRIEEGLLALTSKKSASKTTSERLAKTVKQLNL